MNVNIIAEIVTGSLLLWTGQIRYVEHSVSLQEVISEKEKEKKP